MKKLHRTNLLIVCLLAAIATGCKNDTTGPTPTNDISYTAIGASDGIGFGGSVVCVPYDANCPNGTGYVFLLRRRLQTDGRTVTLANLSFPGAVISPAFQTLARSIGREIATNFLDQQSLFVPSATTHVTIFAGGNDANTIGQAIRAGVAGSDIRGFIDRQVQQFAADYDELLRRIRARSGSARIVALNVPNLGAAPYLASATTLERSIVQSIAVGLTDRVNALRSQNVLVVDLMCEARLYNAASFSSDGFHPSDAGYQLMADLAFPALSAGTAPTPSSTCAQRTLLPVF
jgi:lysophospholipase L1-like esterase